jgi:hypothetical protein
MKYFFAYQSKLISVLCTVLFSAPAITQINSAPDQPVLVQPANGETGVSASPTLEITVTDPDADDMSVTFYGRQTGATEPGDNFTIIGLPDTQNEAQYYPAVFDAQTQWIADNKTSENIVFVTHLGDIVNTADNAAQWNNADHSMDILDAANVAYSVGPGNHDLPIYTTTSLYPSYFGNSRFAGKSYYGGSMNSNNYNNYSLFSASGMDFIIINLQYEPTTAMLDWADALLKANADRRGIVASHSMLNIDNSFNIAGTSIYNALKDNPNIFLMICGHMHSFTDGAAYREELADDGHTIIHIMLADYQDYPNGGNGYMRILRFSPDYNMIYVTTYSPYIDAFITSPPDQIDISYEMAGQPAAFNVIGISDEVSSGSNASVLWEGLVSDTEYEWYAEISDGSDITTGPLWSFTTGDLAEPGISGDVNGDDAVNSTDALIILSCDVGINVSQFCPMNCGDANGDGLVNSTDALIILSYDVGMSVPFPVGEPGCPSDVTPCPGCTP